MYREKVPLTDIHDFRRIVEAYWQEVMPQSDVMKNPDRREAYFRECFTWAGGHRQPYWAVADGRRVGFVAYTVDTGKHSASIEGFYVVPAVRRRGYGAAMMQAVYAQLDTHGVELVELNLKWCSLRSRWRSIKPRSNPYETPRCQETKCPCDGEQQGFPSMPPRGTNHQREPFSDVVSPRRCKHVFG
jgi:GNAT superfamily N-acetyltransferase